MSWVKDANKIGRYDKTYLGFRIYVIVEPTSDTKIEERQDGKYSVTTFTSGHYKAVNRKGKMFEGKRWDVVAEIEKQNLLYQLDKRFGGEHEFRKT